MSAADMAAKRPVADRQGQLADAERVAKAMQGFAQDFGRTAALYMESCIHCGMCAEACHFYEVTHDPKYTPIWKLEPFKQAYKREHGPFAFFYRALNLKREVTANQLEDWQHLLYDSCTVCGRCSLMCPMGIDIAGLISDARHGMARAGLVPKELRQAADRGARARRNSRNVSDGSPPSTTSIFPSTRPGPTSCTRCRRPKSRSIRNRSSPRPGS